jgi:zinc transport system substrate-binding protein
MSALDRSTPRGLTALALSLILGQSLILGLPLILGLSLAGCAEGGRPGAREAPSTSTGPVLATTYPLAFAASWMLDGVKEVELLPPAGTDPLHWRPSRDALGRLRAAPLVVLNGAGAEPWLDVASLPRSRCVDTTAALAGALIAGEERAHRHGPAGEHTHAAPRPHTWLDPQLFGLQVRELAGSLERRFPDARASIRARLAQLGERLDELDRGWSALAPALRDRPLHAFDDSYVYLARRYDLTLVPIDRKFAPPPEQGMLWVEDAESGRAWAAAAPELEIVRVDALGALDREDAAAGLDFISVQRRAQSALAGRLGVELP